MVVVVGACLIILGGKSASSSNHLMHLVQFGRCLPAAVFTSQGLDVCVRLQEIHKSASVCCQ